MSLFTDTDVIVYQLKKDSLKEILGENYLNEILICLFRENLKKNKFFSDFILESQIDQIFSLFELKKYNQMDVVFKRNKQENKKICLIIEGGLIEDTSLEIVAERGQFFGDKVIRINEE